MKKSAFSVILAVLMIVALFTGTLTGCDPSHPVTPSDIVVTATETTVQLHESQVTNYDYTALFTVTKDGQAVTVQNPCWICRRCPPRQTPSRSNAPTKAKRRKSP